MEYKHFSKKFTFSIAIAKHFGILPKISPAAQYGI